MLTHSAKGITVEIARRTDEADNAGTFGGVFLNDLPQRPAPKIDIKVVEVLDTDTMPGRTCGSDEILKNGKFLSLREPGFGSL